MNNSVVMNEQQPRPPLEKKRYMSKFRALKMVDVTKDLGTFLKSARTACQSSKLPLPLDPKL